MKQKLVRIRDLQGMHNILYSLLCLHRWSELIVGFGNFTELGKQALNMAIAYIFGTEAKHCGANIDFKLFPKLAIQRAFIKTEQCDIPERNFSIIFHLGNVQRLAFEEKIKENFDKVTSKRFADFIQVPKDTIETQIFNASRTLATYIEFLSLKNVIPTVDFLRTKKQIEENLFSFSYLPGFDKMMSEEYMDVFQSYSQLRNRIRWETHPRRLDLGDLGHCFDVAIFAYLMSLEKNSDDIELATRFFFMGIFHDYPERWTGDFPSPKKDAYGIRKATEEFELLVMNNNVYSKFPEYQVEALKHVMLEDKENQALKAFLKKSDNFAAYVECYRELDAGSNHKYYREVIKRDYLRKEQLTPNFRLLMEVLYDELFHQ